MYPVRVTPLLGGSPVIYLVLEHGEPSPVVLVGPASSLEGKRILFGCGVHMASSGPVQVIGGRHVMIARNHGGRDLWLENGLHTSPQV